LEATPLPVDEETEAKTSVSVEGDMNRELIFHAISAGRYAGVPSRGGEEGGVVRLPLTSKTEILDRRVSIKSASTQILKLSKFQPANTRRLVSLNQKANGHLGTVKPSE
jgi:hypothetical protein